MPPGAPLEGPETEASPGGPSEGPEAWGWQTPPAGSQGFGMAGKKLVCEEPPGELASPGGEGSLFWNFPEAVQVCAWPAGPLSALLAQCPDPFPQVSLEMSI